jgi:hypothetical protein
VLEYKQGAQLIASALIVHWGLQSSGTGRDMASESLCGARNFVDVRWPIVTVDTDRSERQDMS